MEEWLVNATTSSDAIVEFHNDCGWYMVCVAVMMNRMRKAGCVNGMGNLRELK